MPVSVLQPSPASASPAASVPEPVLAFTPVATASFPLHSPSLLETGVPTGERAPGRASGGPSAERQWELESPALSKGRVLPLPSP